MAYYWNNIARMICSTSQTFCRQNGFFCFFQAEGQWAPSNDAAIKLPLRPVLCLFLSIMNLLRLLRAHIPPCSQVSGRTSLQELHRLFHHHISNQTRIRTTKQDKQKKKTIFFAFCRIWGRNLITTAGAAYARHREKNSRRQMNIQSKWQNMRGDNWQMKRQRMCS